MTATSYTPSPKQQLFHRSDAKYRLVLGAYGAGKTTLAVWEDILGALEFPRSVGVVFRRTYPALRDTTQRQYLEQVPAQLGVHYKKTEGREQIEYPNGSRTLFRCLDDWMKQGSAQYDRITIDEASEVPEREFRALAYGRLRGEVGPRRMVVATNPVDDTHYLYKFFVEEHDDEKAVFHFSTYDNAEHLPPGYIARLEKMSPQEQRMFLHGHWGIVADGPPVFPNFREDIHVGDFTPIRQRPVLRGWDFGFQHPACVFVQADAQGHLVVLRELLGEHEDIVSFGTKVMHASREWFYDCTFEDYCDVSGSYNHDTGPTSVSVLKTRFKLSPHYRKLPLERSLQAMRDLLGTLTNGGRPLLRFDRSCRRLIKGVAGGYYMDPRTGAPKKANNIYVHLIDALRYALAPSILPMRSLFEGKALPRWRIAV